MIRRLLCLLGFHKWHSLRIYEYDNFLIGCLKSAKYKEITRCIYCGKKKSMIEMYGYIIIKSKSNKYAAFLSDSGGITFDIREAERYSLTDGLAIQKTNKNALWISDIELEKYKMLVAPIDNIKKMDSETEFANELYGWLLSSDLNDCFTYCCWWEMPYWGYEIVDTPHGEKQGFEHDFEDKQGNVLELPEKFKYIDHEYCDQRSYGMEGDSFEGELYFPLPNGKYMRCHYQC